MAATQNSDIRQAAVIGAGVMGAQIAAQIANAGIPVKLLDIVKDGDPDRSAIARAAIARLGKMQPAPLMSPKAARLITPGNIEDDLGSLAECDWIVEAVIERLDVKQALYAKLAEVRKPGSVVTSNTSTIPLGELTDAMPVSLKPDFLITHFFNPPRHMRLLELVAGPETREESRARIAQVCDVALGKSVIACNDTPGFIANRIGTYWIQTALLLALDMGLEVEAADAVMGRPMGFPSTGVFGLIDLVGLDLGPHVNASLARLLPENDPFHTMNRDLPFITAMIGQGYTGRKGKGGFYRREGRGRDRVEQALSLSAAREGRLEWRPKVKPDIAEVSAAKKDLKRLVGANSTYGRYAWGVLGRVLAYAASLLGEIASDAASIDEAMRVGYTWKYGPFELIDRLGADWVAAHLADLGIEVPPILAKLGKGTFYKTENGALVQFGPDGAYHPVTRPDGVLLLEDVKRRGKPVLGNKSASVWDLGDGVLCFEIHSTMNSIDGDILALLQKTIALVPKAHKALVIHAENLRAGPGKENFSVGANLGLAMFAANLRMWGKIEGTIKEGQKVFQALREAPFPVVGAPSGRALGGGCEILLHCDAVQAHAETYIGLVEAGVGLVPGWGGCATMLGRWQTAKEAPKGPMPAVSKVFEMVSTAKVATSAAEAKQLKFLRESDGITMNRLRVLADAKARALAMTESYAPNADPVILRLPGDSGRCALSLAVGEYRRKGIATPHDVTVAGHLATVLTGGDTDLIDEIPDTAIRDLERAAFMALFRTKESQARIKHILETGKPLRN